MALDTAATALERLQPYHRPPGSHGHIEHPLLLLKELADADKHRVLAASYGSVDLGQVLSGEALVWDKAAAEAGDFHRTAPEAARQGGLRRGDEIARLRFRRGNEVANPRVEPQPLVDMVFESDSWGGITLWNLGSCVATADQCISQLAPFFPDQRWPPETHDPTSPYEW